MKKHINWKLYFKFNWKLYISFLSQLLFPTIWILIRSNIITSYKDVTLFPLVESEYAVIFLDAFVVGLIYPIYSFIGKIKNNDDKTLNKVRVTWLTCGLLYLVVIIILSLELKDLLQIIYIKDKEYITQKIFFQLQIWANYFEFLIKIGIIFLLAISRNRKFWFLLVFRLLFGLIFDFVLSNQKIFSNIYIGIGLSSLLNNIIIFSAIVLMIGNFFGFKRFFSLSNWNKNKFVFLFKHKWKKTIITFSEKFINQVFYLWVILRNVNMLEKAEAYWLTNKIIFSLVLVLTLSLIEIYKVEVKNYFGLINNRKQLNRKIIKYGCWSLVFFGISFLIIFFSWKTLILFLTNNNYDLYRQSFSILKIITPFFIFYILSSILDGFFISKGKMIYMLIESIIVNFGFYSGFYLLIYYGVIQHKLESYIIFFGLSFIIGFIINLVFYIYFMKQKTKNNVSVKLAG